MRTCRFCVGRNGFEIKCCHVPLWAAPIGLGRLIAYHQSNGFARASLSGWYLSDDKGVDLKEASVAHTARIVVIEDNDSDVYLLDRALKMQNFQFEMVHLMNGHEALAFIRKQGAYADAPFQT